MLSTRNNLGKRFIEKDFLLQNPVAVHLYHEFAEQLPVIDFHNHLNPLQLCERNGFENITQLWIRDDPYKHRAMRISGIPEKYITGDASDKEKFMVWAQTVPKTLGNPLFHWNNLELKRIFDVDEVLTSQNAEALWEYLNQKISQAKIDSVSILKNWNAELICTSDDLLDDLSAHQQASLLNPNLQVKPSLRSDSILGFDQPPFRQFVQDLSRIEKAEITDLHSYLHLVKQRLNYFDSQGCRLADHALDPGFVFDPVTDEVATRLFQKVLAGVSLPPAEVVALKSWFLVELGKQYASRGWILQLHIGAQRQTSSRLRKLAGPAGGYAAIGNSCNIDSLCRFFDALERQEALPRTILYTLNPSDNESLASLTGSYAEDGVPGKIQFGPAWWYNDHLYGINQQLTVLANYGLMSQFVGMTTDSRSVLSFSRHEYFRRILCNLVGSWVQSGEIPEDFELLGPMIENISYYNIKKILKKEQDEA